MNHKILEYIKICSKSILEGGHFYLKKEVDIGQTYFIVYRSKNFDLKIEKYFKEFQVTLYRVDDFQNEISLYNLLNFLNININNFPKSKIFQREQDSEKNYKQQLNEIFIMLFENYIIIDNFFNCTDFELKLIELKKFIISKNPELFKRS